MVVDGYLVGTCTLYILQTALRSAVTHVLVRPCFQIVVQKDGANLHPKVRHFVPPNLHKCVSVFSK